MIKRILIFISASALAGAFTVLFVQDYLMRNRVRVLLVCEHSFLASVDPLERAYASVLEEEGIPFAVISPSNLLSASPEELASNNPALIFPDSISSKMPDDIGPWMKKYLGRGGNLAVIYDAGTKALSGAYRDRAIFAEYTGVNYIRYKELRENAFFRGTIEYKNAQAQKYFEIPPGKIYKGNLLSGYVYGSLQYSLAANAAEPGLSENDIYAYAVSSSNVKCPALILRKYGPGEVLYVNLPLGFLKAYSDDLPLRSLLRTFLFKVVKIPHLVSAPNAKGGIIFDWHIDASLDWKSIPRMLKDGYLRKGIEYSMDITAGDFRDAPGDNLGFNAAGKGRKYVEMLMPYGVIGSHGGWAHNWFAENVQNGTLGKKEIEYYVRKNNDSLESITGYKIEEYAAPVGVHPQPVMTEVLDKLGFNAYYYTGDSGSAPNRTFINGKVVAGRVLAFPIMPFGTSASFYEMEKDGKTENEVRDWLVGTVDYTIQNRVVRLIYSHPYNIQTYPNALKQCLDYVQKRMNNGALEARSMEYFANFTLRFLKTKYYFKPEKGALKISLSNRAGLDEISVAVPRGKLQRPEAAGGDAVTEDEDYFYITHHSGNAPASGDKEKIIYVKEIPKN